MKFRNLSETSSVWYVHPHHLFTPPESFHLSSFSYLFLSNICLKLSFRAVNSRFSTCDWSATSGHKGVFAWEQLLNVQYVECIVCIIRVQVAGGLEPGSLLSAQKNKRQVTLQPVKSAVRNTSESHNWLHRLIKGRETEMERRG